MLEIIDILWGGSYGIINTNIHIVQRMLTYSHIWQHMVTTKPLIAHSTSHYNDHIWPYVTLCDHTSNQRYRHHMQYQIRHPLPPQPKYRWKLHQDSTSLSLDNSSRFIAHPALHRQGLYQHQRSFPKYSPRFYHHNLFYKYPELDLRWAASTNTNNPPPAFNSPPLNAACMPSRIVRSMPMTKVNTNDNANGPLAGPLEVNDKTMISTLSWDTITLESFELQKP